MGSIEDGKAEFERGQQSVLEQDDAQPGETAIEHAALEQLLGDLLLPVSPD